MCILNIRGPRHSVLGSDVSKDGIFVLSLQWAHLYTLISVILPCRNLARHSEASGGRGSDLGWSGYC